MAFSLQDFITSFPSQSVTLESGTLSYRVAGHGPPLLLLHGWGGSSMHWYGALLTLSDTYTVYALDMPGYGESPPLPDGVTVARMADVVMAFADTMGIEQFDLNGHSFGGGVATYIAAHWPERVGRLIITSFGRCDRRPAHFLIQQTYIQMALTMAMWRPWVTLSQIWWQPWVSFSQLWWAEMGLFPMVPRTMVQPFVYELPPDQRLLLEGYTEFILMDQRTSFESMLSLGDPALSDAMATITAPTLVIAGRQDMVIPTTWIESAALCLPDSRLAWLDHCGHIPMIERPDTYYSLLRHFLVGAMDMPMEALRAA